MGLLLLLLFSLSLSLLHDGCLFVFLSLFLFLGGGCLVDFHFNLQKKAAARPSVRIP